MSEGSNVELTSSACGVRMIDAERVAAARARLPEPDDLDAMVELFKALGDPTRARIVYALLEAGELCVCDLAATLDAPESTVSHALRWLRAAGVVGVRRSGRMMFYAVGDEYVVTLLDLSRAHCQHRDGVRE